MHSPRKGRGHILQENGHTFFRRTSRSFRVPALNVTAAMPETTQKKLAEGRIGSLVETLSRGNGKECFLSKSLALRLSSTMSMPG